MDDQNQAVQGNDTLPISIPLGNKPFASPYYSIGREECKNLFLENASTPGAKAQYYLLKIAGLRRFGSLPPSNYGACRMLFTASNQRVFGVFGNQFQELFQDGSRVIRGALNTTQLTVNCADNGNLLMLVDGRDGWIYRYGDNNFTRIADPDFPGVEAGTAAPTHVAMLDTYFIVNVPGTNQYRWSWSYYVRDINDAGDQAPYDPAEQSGYWNQLNMGQKIGQPDNIVALAVCNNYLWLIGQGSSEVHYDTGNFNQQLFARYSGALIKIGTEAPYSAAVYVNNIIWLGRDNEGTLGVYTNNDMVPTKISTRGIEQMIEDMSTWSDCYAFTYWQSGHAFYVMQFPSAERTLVYDLITQSWHERTHLTYNLGTETNWDGSYTTGAWDMVIAGDLKSPTIYQLDPKYYQNDNALDLGVNYIRCRKTTPIQFNMGLLVIYRWFQVICNQGSGTIVDTAQGVGSDPHVQVAWADDTGLIFGNERSARIGKQGQYQFRSRILGCGSGRNRVIRITMTDPVPFILVGLLAKVEPTRLA